MQNILIARQPVFNRNYQLSSYELLFRNLSGIKKSDEYMTANVIVSALLDIGLDELAAGYKININAPASLLLSDLDILHSLPPERVGIEILESVPVNDAVLTACKRLKEKGFTILLDDIVYAPHLKPLIELADTIKVDLPRVKNLKQEVRELSKYPAKLLAEKVETHAQFLQVQELNFDYFQGYFYSRPEIIQGRKVPESKLAILSALQQVMTAEAVSDIHNVIKQDVTLSYRLMKYINSASFGLKQQIESIEQALSLLGLNNIRRWLSVLALAALGQQKTPELFKTALIRAYLLEQIAIQRNEDEVGDDFLLGMFSILDALLDVTMEQALKGLHLPNGVKQGLLTASSDMGKKLSMCKSLEQGNWGDVQQWTLHGKSIDITCITRLYIEAIAWSDTQVSEINT